MECRGPQSLENVASDIPHLDWTAGNVKLDKSWTGFVKGLDNCIASRHLHTLLPFYNVRKLDMIAGQAGSKFKETRGKSEHKEGSFPIENFRFFCWDFLQTFARCSF